MKGTLRAVALVVLIASAGAIAGLAVGAIMGMSFGDLAHLAVPIAVSTVVTVGAAITANAALRTTSLRYRFVVVAVLGAGIALANLAVMARLMLVSDHDIAIVMLLVVFGAGTAVALAMVLASSSTKAVDRLVEGAGRIGDGDLGTRIGDLNAGPELDALAGSLDAAADRLRVARESETQAEQMRRDLIVAVSHDLRTPLASLRAMVEAIDDGVVQDPSTVRRYAGEMRRSVEQLVTMVDDLFELTQLDAGAIRAETTRASLDDVVRSALAAIEPTAQLKGVEIVADLEAARRRDVLAAPRAGPAEPPGERGPSHALRRDDPDRSRERRSRPDGGRRRYGGGDRRGRPGTGLRAVLPRRPRSERDGSRIGPRARPADRDRDGRIDRGGEPARCRFPLRRGASRFLTPLPREFRVSQGPRHRPVRWAA